MWNRSSVSPFLRAELSNSGYQGSWGVRSWVKALIRDAARASLDGGPTAVVCLLARISGGKWTWRVLCNETR